MLLKKSQAWLTFSTKHVLAFVKYKKGIWCAYKTFFHCSIKISFVFVCHGFLQSQVGSELLFYQLVSMRIPAHSLDMLDPVLCVAWRILKLLLKLHNSLWRKCFYGDFFCQLKVCKFHLTMLVLNAFPAISEGLKLKFSGGACPRMPPGGPR